MTTLIAERSGPLRTCSAASVSRVNIVARQFFSLSDARSYMSGADLRIDGGHAAW